MTIKSRSRLWSHRRNILRAPTRAARSTTSKSSRSTIWGDARINAHLTRYDTVHGRFGGYVKVDGDALIVNGDRIRVLSTRDPSQLPWALWVLTSCTSVEITVCSFLSVTRDDHDRSRRHPCRRGRE